MKTKREPPRYEQAPYEAKRWAAADAAAEGYVTMAARLFREAAAMAPSDEWKADCLEKATMMERRVTARGGKHVDHQTA